MSSKQSTVDFITDQTQSAGRIRSRKMFGEYALYCDEKVVALICDDQLFVKPTEIGEKMLGHAPDAPPYPGAKLYFLVPEEKWDDRDFLTDLIQQTAALLPTPKLKKKK